MQPTIVNFQVQYFVAWLMSIIGDAVNLVGIAITTFGSHLIQQSGNYEIMARLTTGIFGTENGLIYWINDKVLNYVLVNMPYEQIGPAIRSLLMSIFGL